MEDFCFWTQATLTLVQSLVNLGIERMHALLQKKLQTILTCDLAELNVSFFPSPFSIVPLISILLDLLHDESINKLIKRNIMRFIVILLLILGIKTIISGLEMLWFGDVLFFFLI